MHTQRPHDRQAVTSKRTGPGHYTAHFSMMGHPYDYVHNMQVGLNVPVPRLTPRIYLPESEDVDSMSRIYTAANEGPWRDSGARESDPPGKRASLRPV